MRRALFVLAWCLGGPVAADDAVPGPDDLELSEEDLEALANAEAIEIFAERPDKPFDRDTAVRLTGEELAARGAIDLEDRARAPARRHRPRGRAGRLPDRHPRGPQGRGQHPARWRADRRSVLRQLRRLDDPDHRHRPDPGVDHAAVADRRAGRLRRGDRGPHPGRDRHPARDRAAQRRHRAHGRGDCHGPGRARQAHGTAAVGRRAHRGARSAAADGRGARRAPAGRDRLGPVRAPHRCPAPGRGCVHRRPALRLAAERHRARAGAPDRSPDRHHHVGAARSRGSASSRSRPRAGPSTCGGGRATTRTRGSRSSRTSRSWRRRGRAAACWSRARSCGMPGGRPRRCSSARRRTSTTCPTASRVGT